MIDQSITDPTAGERARRTRLNPERYEPIVDPTDPRCGSQAPAAERSKTEVAAEEPRSVDG